MLGKNLYIYQMNNDSGISILTGYNQIEDELSNNEIDELIKICNQLKEFINIDFSLEEIKPIEIKKIIEVINHYINDDKNNDESKKKVCNLKNQILNITFPTKRFNERESSFIKAIKEGDWVFIDGIEFAPPHFSEKISSLCNQQRELELFEYGEKYLFKEGKNIHEDFHLFITYNPLAENCLIDQSLLNKCVSFTLPPIDSTIESSAQILYGILKNKHYSKYLSQNIAGRLAKVHKLQKKRV